MKKRPELSFENPKYNYDELEEQLNEYELKPKGFIHDKESIITIREEMEV